MIDAKGDAGRFEAILGRVEELERDGRRARWLLAAAFLAAVGLVAGGSDAFRKHRGPIEARGFVLIDADGRPRGRLALSPDGRPRLALHDDEGRDVVELTAEHRRSASLSFLGRDQTYIHLGSGDDGSAALRLIGEAGSAQAALYLWPGGTSGLALSHERTGVAAEVQPGGPAGLAVVDAEGEELGRLGLPAEARALGLTRRDGGSALRVDRPESLGATVEEASPDVVPAGPVPSSLARRGR